MQLTYVYRNNFIYRANPVVKLAILLSYFTLSLIFDHPVFLFALFINIFFIALFAECVATFFQYLKMMALFSIFIVFINLILNSNGTTVLIRIPPFFLKRTATMITAESIISSVISIQRLMNIITIFGTLNLIVNPDELIQILAKIRLPFGLTLIFTLSIQFFPLLLKDMERIREIQQCQGVELQKGNWLQRIKNNVNLILPLLTNSLERSIQVAEALESRGFGREQKRSVFLPLVLHKGDIFLLFILLGSFAGSIAIKLGGYGELVIYPTFLGFPNVVIQAGFSVLFVAINLGLLGLMSIRRDLR